MLPFCRAFFFPVPDFAVAVDVVDLRVLLLDIAPAVSAF
jgi:hypothetical protein